MIELLIGVLASAMVLFIFEYWRSILALAALASIFWLVGFGIMKMVGGR